MAASLAVAAQLLAVPSAFASPEDDRVRVLEDRLRALEDRLTQSEAVIETQRAALGDRATTADVKQGSTIDRFFQTVEVGGGVSASYAYNFNRPETNAGAQALNQFNQNDNEFSLDAVKLELGKKASEPGTAGFQLDLLFGRNAGIFNQASGAFDPGSTGNNAADTDVFVQEGYLSYNLGGIEFKAGKFETPLGFEVIDSNDNPNVTHGLLFTFLIPLFHTGLLAGGNFNEQLSWQLGVTNGFNNTRENGDNKGVLGRLAFNSGSFFAAYNLYYGTLGENRIATDAPPGLNVVGDDAADTLINDFIIQLTPSDSFTTWLNVDYGHTDRRRDSTNPALFQDFGTDPTFFGAALGAKTKLGEKAYFAFRGEYVNDDNSSRFGPLFSTTSRQGTPGIAQFDEIDIYTLTATLGYQFSSNLLGRFELRRDVVDCDRPSCSPFRDSTNGGTRSSDFGIVELVYSFD